MRKFLQSSAVMTLLLAPAPALTADLAYKAPQSVAPVSFYQWTGFYIGGHIGGGWGEEHATELPPGVAGFPAGSMFAPHHLSGFLGGVQGGYNWQASNHFVLGVEGEYSWADLSATASTISPVAPFVSTTTIRSKELALATGRLGYAANNWLFFVKGGAAWAYNSSTGVGTLTNGTFVNTNFSSLDRSGWTAGGGVEWGFKPNWSAKIEYDHVDFGSATAAVNTSNGLTALVSSSNRVDLVKAGVNYRFNGGGPVVARY
jgi:outer membrane immunogenic protein